MKKLSIFVLFLMAVTLCLISGCKGKVVENNATENVVIGNDVSLGKKDIFVKANGIKSVDRSCSYEFSDGSQENGVLVSADTVGASAFYYKAINLNNLVDKPIITFDMLFNSEYYATSMEFDLVDIYDENNYLSVKFGQNDLNGEWTNVTAKSSAISVFYGYNNYQNGKISTEGSKFYGNNFTECYSDNCLRKSLNFSFDLETSNVYYYTDSYHKTSVLNLNDDFFAEEEKFKGFTDGRIYLRLRFAKLVKKGGMLIEKIADENQTEFTNSDKNNDNIKFAEPIFGNVLHDGATGYRYNLPTPIFEDFLFGSSKIGINVASGDEIIDVTDNAFIPEKAGNYVVKYSSEDFFGNKTCNEFTFVIKTEPNKIGFDYEDAVLIPGNTIKMPEVAVSGGSGKITSTVTYLYNDEPIETPYLYIEGNGALTVKISAYDEIGYTAEGSFTYATKKCSIIDVNGNIPYAIAKGEILNLPDFSAYDYSADKAMSKSIYINGIEVTDSSYTVAENYGDKLIIEYFGDKGKTNEISKKYEVNIIEPQIKGNIYKYFVYDNTEFTADSYSDKTSFVSNGKYSEAKIDYGYALSTEMLELSLAYGDSSRYEYLEISLKDYLAEETVSFRIYYKDANYVIYYRNAFGEYVNYVLATGFMEKTNVFTVYYNNADCSLLDYQYNSILKFAYDDNGKIFSGFSGNAVYISFKMSKVKLGAELNIIKLSNQSFTSIYNNGDKTKPVITFDSVFDTSKCSFGDTVTVPAAKGIDALSVKFYNVLMTAYDPDGIIIAQDVIMNESQSFVADKYGVYTFAFKAVDNCKNTAYMEYSLEILDNVAPVIQPGKVIDTVDKGKAVSFAFSVSDNYSQVDGIEKYILIWIPDKGYIVIAENEKYTFTESGTYEITYFARDEAANTSIYTFSVKVK